MNAEFDFYQDIELRDAKKQIRLLRLLPTEGDEGISAELTVHDACSAPPYFAISYTWGPRVFKAIRVNGVTFDVTQNCYLALCQVQQLYHHRYIWIDSICIDQGNDREKGPQVRQMYSIYTNAEKVLASLGEDFRDCHWLSWLTRVLDLLDSPLRLRAYSHVPIRKSLVKALLDSQERRLRLAVVQILGKDYWKRVWIAQEIAAASSNLEVICGILTMPWSGLKIIDFFCQDDEPLFWLDQDQVPRDGPVGNLTSWSLPSITQDLTPTGLFSTGRRLECSDPRDQIYGLFNLIDWVQLPNEPPRVDYTISTFELACKYTAYLGSPIDPRNLRSMLDVMKISQDCEEIYSLVVDRINAVPRSTRFDQDDQEVCYSAEAFTTKLGCTTTGLLTVELAGTGEASIVDYGLRPEMVDTLQHTLSSRDPIVRALRAKPPRTVYHNNDIIGLVCHQAQPGDLLVRLEGLQDGSLLVLRHANDQRFDLVGQGVLLKGYHLGRRHGWAGHRIPQYASAASTNQFHVKMRLSVEDAIVLFYQNHEYRLWTDPLAKPADSFELCDTQFQDPGPTPSSHGLPEFLERVRLSSVQERRAHMTRRHEQDAAEIERLSILIETVDMMRKISPDLHVDGGEVPIVYRHDIEPGYLQEYQEKVNRLRVLLQSEEFSFSVQR